MTKLTCWIMLFMTTILWAVDEGGAVIATPKVTRGDIASILTERQIAYSERGDKSLEFNVTGTNGNYIVSIVVDPDNSFLYLNIANLMVVSPTDKKADSIMPALMDLNYRSGIIKYEWNRKAGEVRASFVFYTKSRFSKTAFITALSELVESVDAAYPSLMSLGTSAG